MFFVFLDLVLLMPNVNVFYLPSGGVSSEECKVGLEPVVDLVQC